MPSWTWWLRWCWLPLVTCWPLIGCSGFDVGIFSEINPGSNLVVELNSNAPATPVSLTSNLRMTVVPGSFGRGEMELRRAVIEYCVPREGETLEGEEIQRSSCIQDNGSLTYLEIKSLRLPANIDSDCYLKDDQDSPCYYPGGQNPIEVAVLNDAGTLSPTTLEWKDTHEKRVVENISGKRIVSTYLPGPCNHPNYVDLYIFIGFKDDPDTSYAIRTNGTETTMFSQASSNSRFKLICR